MFRKHLITKLVFSIFLFLYGCNAATAQNFVLPNEELVYAFHTTNGKKVVVAKDTADQYLVYRFGTKKKIEFEYPEKNENSWKKFTYSFYLRGGGKKNDGLDLNYLQFTNGNYKYVVFDTYSAMDNHSDIGIKVIDLTTQKTILLKGIYTTQKGSLIDFRRNELIEQSDEMFD